jgi:hypothetical protein
MNKSRPLNDDSFRKSGLAGAFLLLLSLSLGLSACGGGAAVGVASPRRRLRSPR